MTILQVRLHNNGGDVAEAARFTTTVTDLKLSLPNAIAVARMAQPGQAADPVFMAKLAQYLQTLPPQQAWDSAIVYMNRMVINGGNTTEAQAFVDQMASLGIDADSAWYFSQQLTVDEAANPQFMAMLASLSARPTAPAEALAQTRAWWKTESTPAPVPLPDAFAPADSDGDGSVSAAELIAHFDPQLCGRLPSTPAGGSL